jgi:hypothetical protein
MEKEYSGNQHVNHVLNITIVDAFLNKNEIGANAPSKYMKKFEKENPKLGSSMKSHLIDDLEKFGVWKNDYDTFFEKRAERISEELDKRIISQDIDKEGQNVKYDDYEDTEETGEVE